MPRGINLFKYGIAAYTLALKRVQGTGDSLLLCLAGFWRTAWGCIQCAAFTPFHQTGDLCKKQAPYSFPSSLLKYFHYFIILYAYFQPLIIIICCYNYTIIYMAAINYECFLKSYWNVNEKGCIGNNEYLKLILCGWIHPVLLNFVCSYTALLF